MTSGCQVKEYSPRSSDAFGFTLGGLIGVILGSWKRKWKLLGLTV